MQETQQNLFEKYPRMGDSKYTWEQAVDWLRQQPDQKELVYHCYYDDPALDAAERFSVSQEWCAVEKLLGRHMQGKVLDIGAGRGISSYAFAKTGCDVVALEPDSSDLVGAGAIQSLIDATNLNIEIVQEYGETLPFADNTFDIVYGRAVLHHANNLPKLCRESARVLKPGGIFLATREHVISRHDDLQKFLDGHALHFLYGGENAYLLSEYMTAIKESNMELSSILGHFDNVINYAPQTEDQFRNRFANGLKKYFGTKMANRISKIDILRDFYGRKQSRISNTPGRHYSFLAVRHD